MNADLHQAIAHRAEQIYIRNGRIQGRDAENWAQAESEILREVSERPPRRTAIVVEWEGYKYVGEYDPNSSDGYTPGEFAAGAPVRVRFDGDKMFVKRPNGKQLKTTIVNKVAL